MKVGDFVVERPHASGVRRIYKENLHDDAADTLKASTSADPAKGRPRLIELQRLDLHENMTHSISSMVLRGTVVAVASKAKHEFSKRIRQAITLGEDHGVEGDAHAGRFMQHRYLARKMPIMPNNRQVHLITSELFTELGSSGFNVAPGDLGENITTAGLDLTKLPLGTRLRLGHSAVVELTGLRTPCSLIDRFQKGLKRAMIMKHEQPMFRCGVLGVAKAPGEIAAGDPIIVELPSSSLKPLPAL